MFFDSTLLDSSVCFPLWWVCHFCFRKPAGEKNAWNRNLGASFIFASQQGRMYNDTILFTDNVRSRLLPPKLTVLLISYSCTRSSGGFSPATRSWPTPFYRPPLQRAGHFSTPYFALVLVVGYESDYDTTCLQQKKKQDRSTFIS